MVQTSSRQGLLEGTEYQVVWGLKGITLSGLAGLEITGFPDVQDTQKW